MTLYQRWIHKRERKLTLRDPHRRIFPFDWGLEWVRNSHNPGSKDPLIYLKEHAETVLRDSDAFFNPPPIVDCAVKDDVLTMATPTPSPHPENNTVYCRLFPAPLQATIQGIILVIGGLLVGMMDNFLRALFIEGKAEMHTLIVFLSIMGGIGYFGLVGMIFGPIIVALGLTFLELYKREFQQPVAEPVEE